ncbi:TetR family transcriptional regulator [Gordonia jinghuaiqii]|uniref:TetR/AcrR family transcriptional regulator n=1 Tax=Gordonia jinghuaiqii TaxID=2758710 RepID=A0A7D7QGY0_9ACTN|nr:TetR/AcrR family transcriptional regulator [Gordonia jinghuaiqii]MCR5979760.1 TetR family transcriptional regulator [Gordonia jinghuaiqii]QMT00844.1 TetR/AcrR family transcriptional regulator [Gordonia jinghuaiqii]
MDDMARPRIHTDDLRDKLLDEAVRVVGEGGLRALSVRDVAHAAGTSTTAVYSLLGNKEGLARGVLIRAFESFASAQEAAADDRDAAGLVDLGTAYVGWALENPRLYELMFGEARSGMTPSEETRAAAARAIEPLRSGVSQAITAGVFRVADVDTVVASLWAQVHGLALLLLSGHFPAGADPVAAATAVIDGWRAAEHQPRVR